MDDSFQNFETFNYFPKKIMTRVVIDQINKIYDGDNEITPEQRLSYVI